MDANVRMWVSSIGDFFVTLSTTIMGAMIQQGQVVVPSKGVFILGVLAGSVAFWGNVKSSLSQSPKQGV